MSEHTHKPIRTCTQAEADLILEVAARKDAAWLHPEDAVNALKRRTILGLLIGTGLRSYELVNLQLCDIEWPSESNAGCYLNLAVTKGGRERVVPVPPSVEAWLRKWVETSEQWRDANAVTADYLFHQADKHVFGKHLDKPMATRSLRFMVERAVKRALGEDALDRISPHTFRHLYITELFERDVPLMIVSKCAGHVNPSTTARYTHPSKQKLYEAVCG